jgi:amidase
MLLLLLLTAPAEGHKGDTSNLLGPPCRNPWCLSLSPGGSSGGSVSAVAAQIIPWAHGTDGGGSIRGPCSLTGTFGVKPTRGLIPGPWRPRDHGDMESWIRHVVDGPITRCVRDAAIYLDACDIGLSPIHLIFRIDRQC